LADNFYYKAEDLEKREKISLIDDQIGQFDTIYGHDSSKRDNFRFISANEVIYSNGLNYIIVNLESGE
jgi:WD40 repeat protein